MHITKVLICKNSYYANVSKSTSRFGVKTTN